MPVGWSERGQQASFITTWRALLALLIGGEALSMLFATALTAAYRWNDLDGAAFLGAITPGDDYHRFIPLMDANSWWIHALWLSAATLFVVSAIQLLRKRRSAFALFCSGWFSGALGNLVSKSMPVYKTAFPHAGNYFTPGVTALLSFFFAAALWIHSRYTEEGSRNLSED